jgi:hypothetical protein
MSEVAARPLAGDVIFVYSGGKEGFLNVEFQRSIFDKDRNHGPWFSHVALALDSLIAFEASTRPAKDDKPTWSEVSLEGGVRFIPVADLLLGATSWRVLRSSNAESLPSGTFSIPQRYISGLYGSEYSIKVFEDYAREVAPLRLALANITGVSAGWTSDPDDVGHRIGKEFRQRVLKDYPDHKFTFEERTFYCSDLIRVVLSIVGLIPKQHRDARVTPSAFYDVLEAQAGWKDVTDVDFSKVRVDALRSDRRESVSAHYEQALIEAGDWRSRHGFTELWDLVEMTFDRFRTSLDGTTDWLNRISGAPPRKKTDS